MAVAKKIRLDVSEIEDDRAQYGFLLNQREGENYEDRRLKSSADENKEHAPPEQAHDPLACFAEWVVKKADYMQKSPVNAKDASESVPAACASGKFYLW